MSRVRRSIPISTGKDRRVDLSVEKRYTIVIVTHNMQQAARVAEFTGFFFLGKLIEFDKTEKIFTKPSDKKTEDYIPVREDLDKKGLDHAYALSARA